jgi:hypothetical protein
MYKYIKVLKKIVCIIILFLILSSFYSVKAATLKEMQDKANAFIKKGQDNVGKIDMDNAFGEIADIGSILTTIGAGVMVAVVTYMGIKYLTAGPDAQAKLKIQLIGVVVSGCVIFGSYFIWKTVVQVANTF